MRKARKPVAASIIHFPKATSILSSIDHMMKNSKDEFYAIPLMPVNQVDTPLYSTVLPVAAINAFLCRYPYDASWGKTEDADASKVCSLRRVHSDAYTGYPISPSNIIIDFKQPTSLADPLSSIISFRSSKVQGRKHTVLRINLKKYRAYVNSVKRDSYGRLAHPEKVMLGYLVDGHHRVEAAVEANQVDYEYPVSLFFENTERPERLSEVFETVNKKRGAPNAIMSFAMRELSGVAPNPPQRRLPFSNE